MCFRHNYVITNRQKMLCVAVHPSLDRIEEISEDEDEDKGVFYSQWICVNMVVAWLLYIAVLN